MITVSNNLAIQLAVPLFVLAMMVLGGYGIVHHRFMDIRITVQRGTVFLMSIVLIAFVFFSVEFVVEKYIYANDELVDIVSAIIGGFVFCAMKRRFEEVTDRVFFRREYDHTDAMIRASEDFSSTMDMHSLFGAIGLFFDATIKPQKIDFFLKDSGIPEGFVGLSPEAQSSNGVTEYYGLITALFLDVEKKLSRAAVSDILFEKGGDMVNPCWADIEQFGFVAVIPTFFRKRMNGLLLVGEKRSGDPLGGFDRELLKVISRHIGVAVENAGLYEAVRHHAEDLEQRVAERTLRIKNMYDAQTRFLADLSHEFQTPLTILKMNVEAFAGKSISERRNASYVMETTLDRLSRLTSGLVDIARFNFSKEASWHREKIDVAALLRETASDCLVLAKGKGIRISAESEDISVLGDRDKLREVLLNLVSNALKYTSAGGLIALSARQNEHEVEIVVVDSGVGIPAQNLSRIFERFYRINDGVSEGAGLGLHLCRKIIEAHGGTIIAESSVEKGSRFIIHLPSADEGLSRL